MKSLQEELPLLKILMEGLAKQFGENCELVLHDYSKEFGSTIVAIENGEVTGRSIGKGGTDIGLKVIQGTTTENGRYNYVSQTQDGRFLRSSTIYLKNDDGKVLGSLCINIDVTTLVSARNYIDEFVNFSKPKVAVEAIVFKSVEDMLVSMINDSIHHIGVPVALMSREQKIEGIAYLKQRGAFKIKNAGNVVAQYYDISKYTVYNYINEFDSEAK